MDPLHPVEVRVLGALLEKDLTTPEYYPMTVNALLAACNQKSNRDPVVAFEEGAVEQALHSLKDKGWVSRLSGAGHRVEKWSHRIGEKLNLSPRELATLCVLMLRGPQTPGELRSRAERMHAFSDLEDVESCLRGMAEKGLAIRMPVPPGMKEARWAHLIAGEPAMPVEDARPAGGTAGLADRVAALEAEVAELKAVVAELRSLLS
ncbi:MAG: YceH family protein [Bryobacteraceae bacterium]|nr:YceH family protein [Bryobacteraceae bacterium]